MKPTFARRSRRRIATNDHSAIRNGLQQEHSFFSPALVPPFFPPVVQRKCEDCEKEKKKDPAANKVQKKAGDSRGDFSPVPSVESVVAAQGTPLSPKLLHFYSQKLRHDFRGVKIHTGGAAAESAKALQAQAYTYGHHIVFANGKYEPGTEAGQRLLVHELVHVRQQDTQQNGVRKKGEDDPSDKTQGDRDTPAEREAEEAEMKAREPIVLSNIFTRGTPTTETVFATHVRFEGRTDADFDGGTGQTKNLKAIPVQSCDGCSGSDCVTVTGQFEITYSVTTSVTLPDVPDGLTPCQEKRVKSAIDGKIAPHEQQHVSAFNEYNGKVKLPVNYTGCLSGLEDYLQNLHDTNGLARKAAAKAKSSQLDPFFVNVDLDCKEPEPPKK